MSNLVHLAYRSGQQKSYAMCTIIFRGDWPCERTVNNPYKKMPGLIATSAGLIWVRLKDKAQTVEDWYIGRFARFRNVILSGPVQNTDRAAPHCCTGPAAPGTTRGGSSPYGDFRPEQMPTGLCSHLGLLRQTPLHGFMQAGRLAPDTGHPRYTRYPSSPDRLAVLPGIAEGGLLPAGLTSLVPEMQQGLWGGRQRLAALGGRRRDQRRHGHS
jgi:hypothetical protein